MLNPSTVSAATFAPSPRWFATPIQFLSEQVRRVPDRSALFTPENDRVGGYAALNLPSSQPPVRHRGLAIACCRRAPYMGGFTNYRLPLSRLPMQLVAIGTGGGTSQGGRAKISCLRSRSAAGDSAEPDRNYQDRLCHPAPPPALRVPLARQPFGHPASCSVVKDAANDDDRRRPWSHAHRDRGTGKAETGARSHQLHAVPPGIARHRERAES